MESLNNAFQWQRISRQSHLASTLTGDAAHDTRLSKSIRVNRQAGFAYSIKNRKPS